MYLIGFVGLILWDSQENRHSGEGKEVDSIKVLIERASIKSLFKRSSLTATDLPQTASKRERSVPVTSDRSKEGWQSGNAAPSESDSSEFGG